MTTLPQVPPVAAQVDALCDRLVALDGQIAALTVQTAPLDDLLAQLVAQQHPVLWLVLGREGIDRPGGLGAITGREVVTVSRLRPVPLLLGVVVVLLIGMALGAALIIGGQ